MNATTEPPPANSGTSADSAAATFEPTQQRREPRIALFIATACGLGYLPKAPGTWGSIGGLIAVEAVALYSTTVPFGGFRTDYPLLIHCAIFLGTCCAGVWSAGRAASFWRAKDPQRVVIDEVSGQYVTILFGCAMPISMSSRVLKSAPLGAITCCSALSWKYLVLGFILFRVFDIWKPFPACQVESLPGGWGIMADDWVAGFYAAVGLWIARAAGL